MARTALLFLALCALGLAFSSEASEVTIIGGEVASQGEFPYVVSLRDVRFGTQRHFCGGAILSQRYIITAAHCLNGYNPSDLLVAAGEHDRSLEEGTEQYMHISETILHPGYDPLTLENDIGVLKLSHKLHFDNNVASISMAMESDNPPATFQVMGWGLVEPEGSPVDILRKANVPLNEMNDCKEAFKDDHFALTDKNLCVGTGGVDACSSDDGGPLVDEHSKIFGVVSWNMGCGNVGMPGVYTRVAAYKDWIDSIAI